MPHLMTPGGAVRAPAGPTGRTGFGVPGWAHPMLAPVEWAALSRPGLPLHWAVLDVAGGPGARPDPYCLAAAARLRESRVTVLGHLAMRDGTRSFGELVADAHRFLDWYGVDGFYLADCPAERAQLSETARTVTTLRALCAQQRRYQDRHAVGPRAGAGEYEPGPRPRAALVFGHGTHPHPGYADLADQLVTFSGCWPDYRWSQTPEWTADHPPERFCHLVHGVPRMHIDEALRVARWQGAGTVWFTDRTDRRGQNPWEALPGYWDELVSRLGPGVSE
ncbi:phage tail protein [Streptomyces bathyalis]|uniref:Phage tail protein n=1 Tax=Streptomyces bathyalis TaxID=2710756 RepID=A0A7T1WS11_9ACTN|nr:spherulation-specific family 4 protein [Streptomyces bathyalis]QPP06702.1 phage tail protein [Streptomyces bathyalis]